MKFSEITVLKSFQEHWRLLIFGGFRCLVLKFEKVAIGKLIVEMINAKFLLLISVHTSLLLFYVINRCIYWYLPVQFIASNSDLYIDKDNMVILKQLLSHTFSFKNYPYLYTFLDIFNGVVVLYFENGNIWFCKLSLLDYCYWAYIYIMKV